MDEIKKFFQNVTNNIETMSQDTELADVTSKWINGIIPHQYTHNFTWLGRPIIQFPQDIQAMQEVIWKVRPDLIIETGIAHGGSLIFSASMLAMLEYCDAVENGTVLDPKQPKRKVLGIDIDIREHNKSAINAHPMANRIELMQGSSTDANIVDAVYTFAKSFQKVLVILDSNHTHEHVLNELKAYAPLVSTGSYCIVFDTAIEDVGDSEFADRPWGKGNNPKTAVWEYLKSNNAFEIDSEIENKLLITVAPDGYLKRKI
ncbi:cephalosporin hydroxylase family protein [uncultured Paraglaciecola sp.]|uniref:cephalosporin hydroxylase family protein n=1 Tax=uncultured Paraglaciecola sp. TaxID=1765024 RepID=UPI002607496A|nr:cephalosporin hydroxylase family protein [uncultured Paraglaciecola sp.]